MHLSLRFAVQSSTGLRPNNEDAAFAGPRLLALADGMGGHAAGEVASALALKELVPLDRAGPSSDPLGELRAAVERANVAIAQRSTTDPETRGMGTTLTALLFTGRQIALAHIGDSRAYLLRNDKLHQITRDDTVVQSLVDEGRLSPAEAEAHPQRNVLLNVLNGRDLEPSLTLLDAEAGDRYLICSDGLSDYVDPSEIARVLQVADPLRCPQELIRVSLRRGSQDNITCIVADVVEGESGCDISIGVGALGDVASIAGT